MTTLDQHPYTLGERVRVTGDDLDGESWFVGAVGEITGIGASRRGFQWVDVQISPNRTRQFNVNAVERMP